MKALTALKQLAVVSTFAVVALPLTAHATSSICDAVAGNLVSNCGFETGDFTGWTEGGNFEFTQVVSGAFYDYSGANSGSFYATLGPVGSDGSLSETLSTSDGTDYTFDFYFASVGDSPSDFSAYWDGTQLLSLSDPNTGAGFTLYSYSVTGTGSDTIQFDFRDDPAYTALDDISVAPSTSPVPEPANLSLLLLGLAAVVMGRQRLLARR
ncbi:MAG: PEP-CTERM sorting domain-containing protein [Terracidiphilus sp.]